MPKVTGCFRLLLNSNLIFYQKKKYKSLFRRNAEEAIVFMYCISPTFAPKVRLLLIPEYFRRMFRYFSEKPQFFLK